MIELVVAWWRREAQSGRRVGTQEAQRSAEEGGKRRSEGEESAEEQTDMKTEGPLLAGAGTTH